MMFSGLKNFIAFNISKWKRQNESSLTSSLLNNATPEIELSNYGRIPSPGSESPSGLLNGESLNVEPIADLDVFFERVYSYYCEKGLRCIIVKWIVELLTLSVTICFYIFFFLLADWNGLLTCGMDAEESGMRKPCDLVKEAIHQHPLTPLSLSKAIIVGYLGLFSIYWIFCFLRFFAELKDILQIRYFYRNSLHLTDDEIQTMPWATILDKIVQLQSSLQLCVVKDLSAHEVVMRLMRKENYLIGMLNKGVLAFPISSWVPGAGPAVKFGQDETNYRLILTRTLEWTLNWCILQSMFDRNFNLRRDFISDPRTLKKRLMVVGFAMLLLSPFLIIFMLVYLFLRHAERFYHHPSTAFARRWSNLSRWMFREFNEVDHLFKYRINSSVDHASEYLKQFPSPVISIVAKFISFVSGGFAAILIIIAFMEESLLEGHIFGRNLIWYAAVFGTITAISRAAITDELLVVDPEGAMSMVVQHTHYMPKRWRGKESTESVRAEFETLFQYSGMMLLEEMASIFLTPLLLLFVVPKQVENILQFIADFTVNVDGVGHVCSFSTFDFQSHGNSNYGSPYNASDTQRSCQGKMEKSFLSFQSNYPSWQPSVEGQQFLVNLRSFREQRWKGPNIGHGHTPQIWQENSNPRGAGHRNMETWRNAPHYNRGFHLDSLWPIDEDRQTHNYILDWYYSCRRHSSSDLARSIPTKPVEFGGQQDGELWIPPNLTRGERRDDEEDWHAHDDGLGSQMGASTSAHFYKDRLSSQFGASTSTPFLNGSVFQHQDSFHPGQPTRSHWWARTNSQCHNGQPQTSFMEPPNFNQQPQTSFMEPPNFNQYHSDNHCDNFSEGSFEEQEQHSDWRGPPRPWRYADDDLEAGGSVDLLFDDVYSRPPEPPSVKRELPRSF